MFGRTEKIYTAYENPLKAEPTQRMVLVREGFCLWAVVFGVFWLLYKRAWVPALLFVVAAAVLAGLDAEGVLTEAPVAVLQFFMNLALGFVAYDCERWQLARRGYRFAGVLVAENEMRAEQRYYEHAA